MVFQLSDNACHIFLLDIAQANRESEVILFVFDDVGGNGELSVLFQFVDNLHVLDV